MPIEWQKSQVSVKSWLHLREITKVQQETSTDDSEYAIPKATWAKAEENIKTITLLA